MYCKPKKKGLNLDLDRYLVGIVTTTLLFVNQINIQNKAKKTKIVCSKSVHLKNQ